MADPTVKVRDVTTGEVKQVTRGQAAAGYAAGQYQLQKGAAVNLTNDDGEIFAFEQGQVQDALRAGYRVADDALIDQDFERQRLTGVGEQAKVIGEAALRGPSLGFVGSSTLGLATPEAEAARRAANPELALGVEVGTGLASSLIPVLGQAKGALGAARGVASLTPAGLAARAGVALEGATARALTAGAPGAARQILGRAVSVGTGGALEGALANVGALAHESQLGDVDFTSETVAAAAEEGALLGAGAGFLLGGAGASFATGTRKLSEAGKAGIEAARQRFGVKSLGELQDKVDEASAGVHAAGAGAEAGAGARASHEFEIQIGGPTPERVEAQAGALEARRTAREIDSIHEGRVKDASKEFREFAVVDDRIRHARNMEDKYRAQSAAIEKQAPDAPIEEFGTAAKQQIDDLHGTLTRLQSDARTAAPGQQKLLKHMGETRIAVDKAIEAGDRGAVMKNMDILKRAVGEQAQFGNGIALRQAYHSVRDHLEDARMYGLASEIQRPENRIWTDILDLSENERLRGMFKFSGDLRASDPFNPTVREADLHAYSSLMRNANKAEFAPDVQRLKVYLQRKADLNLQMVVGRGGSGAELEMAQKQVERAKRLAAQLDDAARDADYVEQAKRRSEDLQDLPFVGGTIERSIRVASRAETLAAAEARSSAFVASIKEAVAGAASGVRKASTTFRKAGEATGRAGRIVGVVQGQHTGKSRRERFDHAAATVKWLASNPGAVIDRVGGRMGPIADHPRLAAGVAMTAARGAQYLATQLPRGNYSPAIIRPDQDKTQRVSDAEMSRWLRKVEAIENPKSVLESMRNGDVTRDQMQALQAVYPSIHQAIVMEAVRYVTESDKPVPYSASVQLSIVTGQPLHPSMQPEFIAAAQAAVKSRGPTSPNSAPMPASGRSAPDTASAHQSKEQRLSAA